MGRSLTTIATLALALATSSACAARHATTTDTATDTTTDTTTMGRPFTQDDDLAIRATLEAQRVAWNRGDLPGFMDAYERSDQLVFTSGGNIRRGWDVTLEKYRARYGDDQASMGKLEFELLEVRGIGADAAVVLGNWRLTDTPQAGQGVFTLVFARTPAGWRIVHDHTSSIGDLG